MNWLEIFVSLVLGLAVTELTDISPWLASRLVRWAARTWSTEPDVAAGYAEEWTAIITERPGKLLKLLTALGFVCAAVLRAGPRSIRTAVRRVKEHSPCRSVKRTLDHLAIENLLRFTGPIAATFAAGMTAGMGYRLLFGLLLATGAVLAAVTTYLRFADRRARRGRSTSGR